MGQRKGAKEEKGGGEAENRRKPLKDSSSRMVEGEIERLKEELRQHKDKEDQARSQINRRLNQKIEDFERLHRDHKHFDVERSTRS